MKVKTGGTNINEILVTIPIARRRYAGASGRSPVRVSMIYSLAPTVSVCVKTDKTPSSIQRTDRGPPYQGDKSSLRYKRYRNNGEKGTVRCLIFIESAIRIDEVPSGTTYALNPRVIHWTICQ